jgi:tetratricopeptide (TPR) repeat protein
LQKEIDAGKNRLRRVFARVRLHQGMVDQTLDLELAYLQKAKLSEPWTIWRRARAFEDFGKTKQAAAEHEKLLNRPADAQAGPSAEFAVDPLLKLYAALGRTDDLLALSLRQFELGPYRLQALQTLEQTAARFGAAGKTDRFTAWVKERRGKEKAPWVRANLCWLLGDHDGTLQALTQEVKTKGERSRWVLHEWCQTPAPRFPAGEMSLRKAAANLNPVEALEFVTNRWRRTKPNTAPMRGEAL